MNPPRGPSFVAAALSFCLWDAVARTSWARTHSIPTPALVAATASRELVSAGIWLDVGSTMARVGLGLAIAMTAGTMLGLALASRRSLWHASEPPIEFVRSVPPILAYPLCLLAFGYGEAARIAAIVFGTTGIVLIQVARTLVRAPRERAEAIALAGLRGFDAMRCLHAYEILPGLFTGARLAFTSALVISIVTEMLVGASHGLGVRAQNALLEYRADMLWVVILIAGAISAAFSTLLTRVEHRLVDWVDA